MFRKITSAILGLASLAAFAYPAYWWGILKGQVGHRPQVDRAQLSEVLLHRIREDVATNACVLDDAYNLSAKGAGIVESLAQFKLARIPYLELIVDYKKDGFAAAAFKDRKDGTVYAAIAGANVSGVGFWEFVKDVPEMSRLTACYTTANMPAFVEFLSQVEDKAHKMPDRIVAHSTGALPLMAAMAYGNNYIPARTQICIFEDSGVTDHTLAHLAEYTNLDAAEVYQNVLLRPNTISYINGANPVNSLGTQPSSFVTAVAPEKDDYNKWKMARFDPHYWNQVAEKIVEMERKDQPLYMGKDGNTCMNVEVLTALWLSLGAGLALGSRKAAVGGRE